MHYELWARSRQTCIYRKLSTFEDEKMFDTLIDRIPKEKYSEAVILKTKGDYKSCELERYEEFKKPKTLTKHL